MEGAFQVCRVLGLLTHLMKVLLSCLNDVCPALPFPGLLVSVSMRMFDFHCLFLYQRPLILAETDRKSVV